MPLITKWHLECHGNLDTERTIMKLSKSQLRRIIREERRRLLNESIEEHQLKEVVFAAFCEYVVEADDMDWPGFVQHVARRAGVGSSEVYAICDDVLRDVNNERAH